MKKSQRGKASLLKWAFALVIMGAFVLSMYLSGSLVPKSMVMSKKTISDDIIADPIIVEMDENIKKNGDDRIHRANTFEGMIEDKGEESSTIAIEEAPADSQSKEEEETVVAKEEQVGIEKHTVKDGGGISNTTSSSNKTIPPNFTRNTAKPYDRNGNASAAANLTLSKPKAKIVKTVEPDIRHANSQVHDKNISSAAPTPSRIKDTPADNRKNRNNSSKKCQLVEKPLEARKDGFCGGIKPKVFWEFLNVDVCRKIYEGDTMLKKKLTYNAIKYGKPIGEPGYQLPREKFENSPVRLHYETFFDVSQGFQDNSGGILNNTIITTGGFCGGDYLQDWLEPYCCGVRGFIKTTKAFDMNKIDAWDMAHVDIDAESEQCKNSARPHGIWHSLPDWPGTPRQGHACVAVEGQQSMYCWGGYSYTPAKGDMDLLTLRKTKKGSPYGYRDGYKLSKQNYNRKGETKWSWSKLPPIPAYQGAMTAMCYDDVSNAIYLIGGADYDLKQFHTVTDREGKVQYVGKLAWKFSIDDQKWSSLPSLPGTPRLAHGVACVKGKVYVLGGASGGTSIVGGVTTFRTIVDNWALNVKTVKWNRVADTPLVIGNWCRATVYKNRYIFLVGGAGYGKIAKDTIKSFWNNGKDKPKVMSHPTSPSDFRRAYSNNVFAYDTKLDKFLFSDPLPINNNCPMVYIHKDYLYVLGGEGGSGCVLGKVYGQHLNMFIRARIAIDNDDAA